MRINQFVAQATGLSRRAADKAIQTGRILINNQLPTSGYKVQPNDHITLDGGVIVTPINTKTIMLNKPVDYVCSRLGQGSKTIYSLLPAELYQLKPVGRLDKNSSGLLLLTNDGDLAHRLTHPSYQKKKIYEIELDKALTASDLHAISGRGVSLEDGTSSFALEPIMVGDNRKWRVTMSEGRNRQIRRTFQALDYKVTSLHRVRFGPYEMPNLQPGSWQVIDNML